MFITILYYTIYNILFAGAIGAQEMHHRRYLYSINVYYYTILYNIRFAGAIGAQEMHHRRFLYAINVYYYTILYYTIYYLLLQSGLRRCTIVGTSML
jgi:hypothetical protein